MNELGNELGNKEGCSMIQKENIGNSGTIFSEFQKYLYIQKSSA
jgi:hypothetical protein